MRAKIGFGFALAVLLSSGVAVLLSAARPVRNQSANVTVPVDVAAPRSSATLAAAPAAVPVDETARLKAQLVNQQLGIQVRAAAAIRLKELAGEGRVDLVGALLDGAALDGAYFFSANFTNASLKAAKLHRVNFFTATLRNADLGDAEFFEADLRGVDATGANLQRADLTRAVLYGADLSDVRLEGAKLQGAHLHGANLSTAELAGADLRGALYSAARTRFPEGFEPKRHGMIECPGHVECSSPLPDAIRNDTP